LWASPWLPHLLEYTISETPLEQYRFSLHINHKGVQPFSQPASKLHMRSWSTMKCWTSIRDQVSKHEYNITFDQSYITNMSFGLNQYVNLPCLHYTKVTKQTRWEWWVDNCRCRESLAEIQVTTWTKHSSSISWRW